MKETLSEIVKLVCKLAADTKNGAKTQKGTGDKEKKSVNEGCNEKSGSNTSGQVEMSKSIYLL